MDRLHLTRRLWTLTLGVALLLVAGFACNTHELNPFGASVRSGAVERTEQGEVRPVDILFVVDNSNSMCEEQIGLRENFDNFINILAEANADFRLAVVNTDMTDTAEGNGIFRTGPGTYLETAICASPPDTSFCDGRMLFPDSNPWLSATNYELGSDMGVQKLQQDFACLGLTGIDGETVEMGLASMKKSLEIPSQREFHRPGALLAVVFVTDENDCSDGTDGLFQPGPVYEATQAPPPAGGDLLCEYNRNIEDSCQYTAEDPGGSVTIDGTTMSARDWCIQGNRDLIQANQGSFDIKCPGGGCTNQLLPRTQYYNSLLQIVAEDNGYEDDLEAAANDIIVAAIINKDGGVRFNQDQPEASDAWCGQAGTQGYRYELFAEMFPEGRKIIAPICNLDDGQPADFAEPLRQIAEVIGRAINSVCLQAPPMQCDADGLAGDGSCLPGKRCCPEGQTCSGGPWLAGTDFEYRTCSGFRVNVELESVDADGNPQRTALVEGEDFSINLESSGCVSSTGSPVEVSFTSAPPANTQLVVSYPREVGEVFE